MVYRGCEILPVPAEHKFAPQAGSVNFTPDRGRCYVLASDWPALREAIFRAIDRPITAEPPPGMRPNGLTPHRPHDP